MCESLTAERVQKVINTCNKLLKTDCSIIRHVAQVIGLITSTIPGVIYGPLHDRYLDMDKTNALKVNYGDF